jgi:hypothetical protein
LTDSAHTTFSTAAGVVVKSWDEDLAVAYALSQGKTHLISAAGAAILQSAQACAVDEQHLLALYWQDANEEPTEHSGLTEAQAHLSSTLSGLLTAGLLQTHA